MAKGKHRYEIPTTNRYQVDDIGYELFAADEKAHARMILDATWSSDGTMFATASRDKTASTPTYILVRL